ncbi:MAG: outer membrane beta-barrel protein [Desulfobulbaceae bacterium]|nr:outer membrane beta-barrel protein [Desulfobulbaceae bacterium]
MKSRAVLLAVFALLPFFRVRGAAADERLLIPSVAFRQEYTDNLYFTARDPMDDFIAIVSPALELSEKTERLDASLKAQLDHRRYFDNSDLNSTDQRYSGDLRYSLQPRLGLFGSATYQRDSSADRDLTETGLVQSVASRSSHQYRLGGDYALAELASLNLAYSFADVAYDATPTSDYTYQNLSCTLSRDLGTLLPLTVGRVNLAAGRYDGSGVQVENRSATVGAERKLDERFSIFANLGGRHTTTTLNRFRLQLPATLVPYEQTNRGWGMTGDAGFSFRGEVSQAALSLSRSVEPASGRNGTTERTALRGTVRRQLSERNWLEFAADYITNKSDGDEFAASAINEETLRCEPKMHYALTDQVAAEAAYVYTEVRDRESDSQRHRSLVWLRLVWRSPYAGW